MTQSISSVVVVKRDEQFPWRMRPAVEIATTATLDDLAWSDRGRGRHSRRWVVRDAGGPRGGTSTTERSPDDVDVAAFAPASPVATSGADGVRPCVERGPAEHSLTHYGDRAISVPASGAPGETSVAPRMSTVRTGLRHRRVGDARDEGRDLLAPLPSPARGAAFGMYQEGGGSSTWRCAR